MSELAAQRRANGGRLLLNVFFDRMDYETDYVAKEFGSHRYSRI